MRAARRCAADYVYSYRLRDRCRACAVLGTAWFAFELDAQGRFRRTRLVGVARAAEDAMPVITDAAQPVVAAAGNEFSIVIASDRSTGYAWAFARPLDTAKVRLVESRCGEAQARRPGAPGMETWTFGALQPRKTEIVLGYRRPWERDRAPTPMRTYTVVIGPR